MSKLDRFIFSSYFVSVLMLIVFWDVELISIFFASYMIGAYIGLATAVERLFNSK